MRRGRFERHLGARPRGGGDALPGVHGRDSPTALKARNIGRGLVDAFGQVFLTQTLGCTRGDDGSGLLELGGERVIGGPDFKVLKQYGGQVIQRFHWR